MTLKKIIHIIFVTFLLLSLWQLCVYYYQIPNYLLPSPLEVATSLYEQPELMANNTLTTLIEMMLGWALGIVCGIAIAIFMILARKLAAGILPLILISQAIPTFAIAPLLVVWLGYGLLSKITMTIFMIFFPVTSAFYEGMRNTPVVWLELAKTFQAKRLRTFIFIIMPAALPSLANGIRIATVVAPIGAIVGEWVGSSEGLGYLMLNANARLQIDQMFAALFIVVIISLLFYFIVDKVLQKLIWWQRY